MRWQESCSTVWASYEDCAARLPPKHIDDITQARDVPVRPATCASAVSRCSSRSPAYRVFAAWRIRMVIPRPSDFCSERTYPCSAMARPWESTPGSPMRFESTKERPRSCSRDGRAGGHRQTIPPTLVVLSWFPLCRGREFHAKVPPIKEGSHGRREARTT